MNTLVRLLVFSSGIVAILASVAGPISATGLPAKAQESELDREVEGAAESVIQSASPISTFDSSEAFTRWLKPEHDWITGSERAWEYRPYRVAVWLCLDGAPQLTTTLGDLIINLNQRAELIDPSGWMLHFGEAPGPFRNAFLQHLTEPAKCAGFEKLSVLQSYDKLMVVCLSQEIEATRISVRECDLTTMQWGPIQNRTAGYPAQIVALTMEAIKQAFMPLTRVDRVELKGPDTTVHLQVRASESCIRMGLTDDQQWKILQNQHSPVFIQPQDRFLPIIRHIDRDGKLLKLQPIEFTFLSIEEITDDRRVICSVTSSQRAPLAGRRSRTAERYALVIRPPNEPSMLHVRSRDNNKTPVNGIKVYSAKPTNRESDDNTQSPDYLGKTDWQGMIEIPPHDDGIRMLTLGRGGRGLIRLPVIPGLYSDVTVEIPNDEMSLYAEGIFQGFESEILNLIIQRDVLEAEINSLLERNDLSMAAEKLKAYRSLESPKDMVLRMASEITQLEGAATGRQRSVIQQRFQELTGILSQKAGVSREMELQAKIQVKANISGSTENPDARRE